MTAGTLVSVRLCSMFDFSYDALLQRMRQFPVDWDGKMSIQRMREDDFQWRQMEWIGFFFEWLCHRVVCPPISVPGPTYGNVTFDGYWNIPWDFKAHVARDAKGLEQHRFIVNDQEAIHDAIREHGQLGLIVAIGEATFNDKDGAFKRWHDRLKGERSKYEQIRIAEGRPSRVRKVSLHVQRFVLYNLNDATVRKLETHGQGRNSDGSPRKPKYALDDRLLEPVATVERGATGRGTFGAGLF